ncbi:spermidine/putrescine ABC transporter, ATP-binding protein [Pseudogulbenkiania sp. NH8B]|uniref:ABC transporter ATP-binding protein n=1 Tax=Pseudogulbenkiania sp. (strain NH8B) TaxID=748280 RepID=UPI0002279986|nr:ABC transporter ATP-binding protein [Pseudogulbenkiania sp. NH8B]BAK77956.1 spermidine/putrescine ABC transporter, ATP-binding protein [Pseudogulbenkiania sp. NH8B]
MLELVNLCKAFGQRVVADHLSLTVADGETLALLGPSGCGKSTLLKMIAGLERPDAGQIRLGGVDLTALAPEARQVALMFQDFALFPHLDVRDNVAFGLIERRLPRREAYAQAERALAELGLAGYGARRVWTLSGGEQQRVALARALVTSPRLLLLDEPFSSLDAHLRQSLQAEFRRRLAAARIPAILVTHDRAEAFALADRVAVLQQGKVVQCGRPQELLAAPRNAWVASFIGYHNVLDDGVLPEQAFLLGPAHPPARVERVDSLSEGIRVELTQQAARFTLTLSAREAAQFPEGLRAGQNIGLGIDRSRLIRFAGA